MEHILREYFAKHGEGLVAVYLFGSVARGTAGPRSDVDVGVLFETAPPRTLQGMPFELEDELRKLLGRDVQVVVLNRAPADLVHRVLRDGILLLERDPAARIRYEVKIRNEYFDLLPYLERYRRSRGAA